LLAGFSFLKIESTQSSKTLINIDQTTRCHNPEDRAHRDDLVHGISQWLDTGRKIVCTVVQMNITRKANQLKAGEKNPQIRKYRCYKFSSQGVLTRQPLVYPAPQTNHDSFRVSSSKNLKHKIRF
jgi:hypothetical protein